MYSRNNSIFWFIFTIVFATACVNQPNKHTLIAQAVELRKQEKYKEAFEKLKPLADSGDLEASEKLGDLYWDKDEKRNPYYDLEKARQAYYVAAKAGNLWGQVGLAQLLKYEVGQKYIEYNYDDVKHPELKEFAVKKEKEACKWYEKAARQGYGFSMMDTARCYRDGYASGQNDYITAYAWFALAAGRFEPEKGDPYAPNSMAEIFMNRTAKRGKLTKEQIQQALDLAKKLQKEIFNTKNK